MKTKTKLGIFYNAKGPGGKFLTDIIKELSKVYDLKVCGIDDFNEIEKQMEMVDLCWFEWCDGLLQFASRLAIAQEKKLLPVYTGMKYSPLILRQQIGIILTA